MDQSLPAQPGVLRRTHLIADVRLALDLAVRYADSTVGRPPSSLSAWQAAEAGCERDAMNAIARVHTTSGVTLKELQPLRTARDWWFDLVIICVPSALIFFAVGTRVIRGLLVLNEGARAPSTILLIVLTPIAAASGLALIQTWSWLADTIRLRNEHLSFRAFLLPSILYRWSIVATAGLLFVVLAVRALQRPHDNRNTLGPSRRKRLVSR